MPPGCGRVGFAGAWLTMEQDIHPGDPLLPAGYQETRQPAGVRIRSRLQRRTSLLISLTALSDNTRLNLLVRTLSEALFDDALENGKGGT